jgi:hypothetical protein
MRVSYGPPATRGVTHLMAVGADDVDQSPTDQAIHKGMMLSVGGLVLGALFNMPKISTLAAGGALALLAVRVVSGAAGGQVAVTASAPVPVSPAAAAPAATSGWFY